MRSPFILPAAMLQKGIYYYTTYDNHQISAVDMHKTDLDGRELARFTPVTTEQIQFYDVSVKSINCVCARTNKQFILIDQRRTTSKHPIKWCEYCHFDGSLRCSRIAGIA